MNKNGFTLPEIVFVSAIMVIMLGALVALYATNHQFYVMTSIFTELRGETKNFKNQITKDIEEAVEVASNHTFPGPVTYTTGPNELVLKCYATTASGFNTSYNDYIAYHKDGTDIKRVVDGDDTNSQRDDSDRTLVENADSMSFEFYNSSEGDSSGSLSAATRIVMDLVVRKTWTGKIREETIHSSARLRNKR